MKRFLVGTALLIASAAANAFGAGMAVDPGECLGCHGNKISAASFAASAHGANGCTSCHTGMSNLAGHMQGNKVAGKVNCSRCHAAIAENNSHSVHAAKGVACISCHSDYHYLTRTDKAKMKAVTVKKCLSCHPAQKEFVSSIHGHAVMNGNNDAPSCTDCHGLHDIGDMRKAGPLQKRKILTAACVKCHGDKEMMARNGKDALALTSYLESYHGKSYRLGFPERVAVCWDCHGAHNILPPSDAASTVSSANVTGTCAKCHPSANKLFAKYYAHGEHGDRQRYPILYWTFMAMTCLLVGTFAVFWVHTLLWMFRGFVENRQREAELEAAGAGGHGVAIPVEALHGHEITEPHKKYKRFEKRHIILHLTVIVSFLGLSLTGLPLKFSDQEWARTMMSFYGGVHYAGLIHRACAVLTFYYFLGAIIMSFDFLFVRKDIKGNFLQRMFGPDSLMPNLRDLRDVTNMVRWFLFRGPKPTFERWTYWEKFDFIAVFWGMFAIGGSGLMLWFPEFFTKFLPGWILNVATIVHSDEALLATGFIFTVHFFNTHGRPEKFPMDFVIFNGLMSKEEFIHERGDQWKRYEEDGITEQFAAEKGSGIIYDFLLKAFGFIALFTGLACAVLMVLSFVKG